MNTGKTLILCESPLGQPDNPFSLAARGLCEFLLDQGQEVVFLTSANACDLPPLLQQHSRFQQISAFKDWNWTEIPHLLSLIHFHKPKLIHLIQPHGPALKRRLHLFDVAVQPSPLWSKLSLVTSILDARLALSAPRSLQTLVHGSDLIVLHLPSQAQSLAHALDLDLSRVHYCPPLIPHNFFREAVADAVEVAAPHPYLLIPGDIDEHDEFYLLESLKCLHAKLAARIIVGGGWGELTWSRRQAWQRELDNTTLGAQLKLMGHLNFRQLTQMFARAHNAFLFTLTSETLRSQLIREIAEHFHFASTTTSQPDEKNPVVPLQSTAPSRDKDPDTVSLWTQTILLQWHETTKPEFDPFAAHDLKVNQLQRLYQRLLFDDAKNQ